MKPQKSSFAATPASTGFNPPPVAMMPGLPNVADDTGSAFGPAPLGSAVSRDVAPNKPNVWPLALGPEKANGNKVCLGCGYSYIDRFHSKKEKGKKNCAQLDCHCGKPKEGHPAFMPPGPYCTGDWWSKCPRCHEPVDKHPPYMTAGWECDGSWRKDYASI